MKTSQLCFLFWWSISFLSKYLSSAQPNFKPRETETETQLSFHVGMFFWLIMHFVCIYFRQLLPLHKYNSNETIFCETQQLSNLPKLVLRFILLYVLFLLTKFWLVLDNSPNLQSYPIKNQIFLHLIILGLGQRSCKVISIHMFYPYIYIGPFKLYINGYIYDLLWEWRADVKSVII